jgi:hypothetical protein
MITVTAAENIQKGRFFSAEVTANVTRALTELLKNGS